MAVSVLIISLSGNLRKKREATFPNQVSVIGPCPDQGIKDRNVLPLPLGCQTPFRPIFDYNQYTEKKTTRLVGHLLPKKMRDFVLTASLFDDVLASRILT